MTELSEALDHAYSRGVVWVGHPHGIRAAFAPLVRTFAAVLPTNDFDGTWYWRVDYNDSGAIRGWDAGYAPTEADAILEATAAYLAACER